MKDRNDTRPVGPAPEAGRDDGAGGAPAAEPGRPSAPAMDKGARALVLLLAWALAVGAVVIAVQPAYRAAFLSLLRGDDDASPLWRSNANYYRE